MSETRQVLLLDIETAPLVSYTWGVREQDVIDIKKDWYILSIAYKWLGERVRVLALPDFKGYRPGGDDKALTRQIHKLLDEARIVIAQNGDAFDIKKINTRFIIHGLPPPSPFVTIDTLKTAYGRFAFASSKLDNLGKALSEGEKLRHRGFEMWKGCMDGNPRDWRDMKRYNVKDVELLERIYKRFRPWISNHPHVTHPWSKPDKCPRCGKGPVIRKGWIYTRIRRIQKYRCLSCEGWFSSGTSTRTSPLTPV